MSVNTLNKARQNRTLRVLDSQQVARLLWRRYVDSPSHEKLVGDLSGVYSRRINIQHRLVHQVLQGQKAVKIIRLWSHYE